MRRRDLLAVAAGAAAWPTLARAQPAKQPVIGFLGSLPAAAVREPLAAFHQSLGQRGYVAGRNLAIEYRWADNQYDRLPGLAAELVRLPATVIVAAGGEVSALAAKAATTSIPIVFTGVGDPLRGGLVASLNRPGGNVTGIAILSLELDAKRLELLHDLVPRSGPIGVLVNATNPNAESQRRSIQTAADALGRTVAFVRVAREDELDAAFATLTARNVVGLVVGADPFFVGQRARVAALAARHRLPGIFQWREFAEAGGMISYGPDFAEAYRQAGNLVGRILRGEKPADLPVLQPTKFEMVINLATAKTLGLTIPQIFLQRADEVIE